MVKPVKPIAKMVQSIRHIRDEINSEIKDMTFAEERAFLDKLLLDDNQVSMTKKDNKKRKSSANPAV